ncbi:MAG: hypothetical protein IJC71_01060 [Clostridia bacterium]|nr:hypothetical protein [Clostridia bacterium]
MKNILTRILLAAMLTVFAVMLASCGEKDEFAAPAGMVTASDEKADFYLYVPEEWTVDYSTAAAGAYYSPADPSSVSVMAWELEHTDTSLDDWWTVNQNDITMVFQNFALESEENCTINDLYAKKYTYTASLGEYNYKIMQAACIKDAVVYLFTYTSLPENFDAHLGDVNEMLEYLIIK